MIHFSSVVHDAAHALFSVNISTRWLYTVCSSNYCAWSALSRCLSFYLFWRPSLPRLRQNLREKHARHIADLRAYYEAEISTLKEKLNLVYLPLDMEKNNRVLLKRLVITAM